MSSSGASSAFTLISEEIKRNGMSKEIYGRIAIAFQDSDTYDHPDLLLEILEHFVSFQDELIYVNEIRNFLKENSPALFKEYGFRFVHCKGCLEVFGIEPVDVVSYDFKVEKAVEEKKAKKYDAPSRRKRVRNSIKRQARIQAASNFKVKLNEKRERKRKEKEINDMIRKQNI